MRTDERTDGQTEVYAAITKLIVTICNFSSACEKWKEVFWNYRSCCSFKVRILNSKKSVDTTQYGVFLSESESMVLWKWHVFSGLSGGVLSVRANRRRMPVFRFLHCV